MNPRKKKPVAFRPTLDGAPLESRALLSNMSAQVATAAVRRAAPRVVTSTLSGILQGRYRLAANNASATISDTGPETISLFGTTADVTVEGSVRSVRQGRQTVLTGTIRLKSASGSSVLDLTFTSRVPAPGGNQVATSNVRVTRATGIFGGITRNTATRIQPRALVTLGAMQPDRTGDFQLDLTLPVRRTVR